MLGLIEKFPEGISSIRPTYTAYTLLLDEITVVLYCCQLPSVELTCPHLPPQGEGLDALSYLESLFYKSLNRLLRPIIYHHAILNSKSMIAGIK